VVELRQTTEGARHHPPGIEQDEHALLAFGLVLDAHRPAAARGGGPRDRARVVVRLVFAQPLEQGAGAGDARAALTRVVREPAPKAHLVAPDLLQIRIDVRGRVRGHAALPLQKVERATQTDVDVAEPEGAAVPRPRRVGRLGDETGADDELRRAPVDVEGRRHRVANRRAKGQRVRVSQPDRDAIADAYRELRLRDSLDRHARWRRSGSKIDDGEDDRHEKHERGERHEDRRDRRERERKGRDQD